MLYINDHLYDFDLDEALRQLSEQRRAQALKFRHEQGRRTCVAAYMLLCEGLKTEYGITDKPLFAYGEHGKPSLADYPHIHFSLSHCREAAACYVSSTPVGIDIESIRPLHDALVEYTMNADEVRLIRESERPDLQFIQIWTQKEALLKFTGSGIVDNMRDVLTRHRDHLHIATTVSPDARYVLSICQKQ